MVNIEKQGGVSEKLENWKVRTESVRYFNQSWCVDGLQAASLLKLSKNAKNSKISYFLVFQFSTHTPLFLKKTLLK
jgi:hypothetical protein